MIPAAVVAAALVLAGDLVTMTDRGVIVDGQVVIRSERVHAVVNSDGDLPDTDRLATDSWIFPGLINLHTHMPFNHQPLWVSDRKFDNRYQWQVYPPHVRAVMTPQRILFDQAAYNLRNEQTLFAEVRALVGGTTALTSSAEPGYYTAPGRLIRNLEYEPPESGRVEAHVAEVDDEFLLEEASRLRAAFDAGELRAWVVHLAEGVDERSQEEFERLQRAGLVRREVVIVHGTGLDDEQLRELGAVGGHLVWAPTSNYLLYGEMADVETAMANGVTVSLSNDWAPSGTHNLLAELKVAAASYEKRYGQVLAPRTLVEMITTNPAKAIGWEGRAGALAEGAYADMVVVAKRDGLGPYETLVAATEEDIELVVVGGEPVFGRPEWMERLKPGDSEVLRATGRDGTTFTKRIDVTGLPGEMLLVQARARLRRALRFDSGDMRERFLDDAGRSMNLDALESYLEESYAGLAAQPLPPIFLSNDADFFDRLRRMQFPFTDVLESAYRPSVELE